MGFKLDRGRLTSLACRGRGGSIDRTEGGEAMAKKKATKKKKK
jgi:hypothetical protein